MDTIKEDEIIEAVKRSGYLLENRILKSFLEFKFRAEANHIIFLDNSETNYREIDISATKTIKYFEIDEFLSLALYTHFMVECINNIQPLSLFENLGDTGEPAADWIYNLKINNEELIETISTIIPDIVHDYETKIIQPTPSKQYCSFTKKKGDHKNDQWMAEHPDKFHRTLLKLVECVKYKFKQINDRWEGVRPQIGRLDIFIPVIILQNGLNMIIQKIEPEAEIEMQEIKYHRLKTPYEDDYHQYVSIDVVSEKYFKEYLISKLEGLSIIFEQIKTQIMSP